MQQENSGIELISPEGYKVKETEEVSKLREIFASQSDENKVFFLNKVELETFFESARKTKKKSGIQIDGNSELYAGRKRNYRGL